MTQEDKHKKENMVPSGSSVLSDLRLTLENQGQMAHTVNSETSRSDCTMMIAWIPTEVKSWCLLGRTWAQSEKCSFCLLWGGRTIRAKIGSRRPMDLCLQLIYVWSKSTLLSELGLINLVVDTGCQEWTKNRTMKTSFQNCWVSARISIWSQNACVWFPGSTTAVGTAHQLNPYSERDSNSAA